MDKVRSYFQHRPFQRWLLSVAITFILMASGGLLLHANSWPLLIYWSVAAPTATAAALAVMRR